ncbi:hypothetical protein PR202_ga31203 [Eleusine coracana subsp. coracana]|uniref:RING-type domain-containing protein n=1 Tax=Eleusine coracana subsp. coracana TaxID=191504 RepID=A0AAV5DRY8_ELECO|nr:hypothetical protein QOZ80_5AG0388990 [Eleusine coracana subsp. coracana]GJN12882.1 hypothetical protein PR202_ga31203 [Eleusine coracana subsp. coracana]
MDDDRAQRNGAWDIVLVHRSPSTARSDRCAKLLLLWFVATGVAVGLFVLTGYVWGSVGTAAILIVGCWFSCYYFNVAPPEPPLLPMGPLRVTVPVGQPQVTMGNGGGRLSQEDIDAIAAYESSRKAAAEQCAVCINVVRDGETVRRLPACGHAFHAPCIDGWLRAHATCPMCRADVKVAGEQPSEAAVV